MLTAGAPVSVVAGRLGHARPATTLNVYSHFVDSEDQAAADTTGEILGDSGRMDGQTVGNGDPGIGKAESEDPA